MASQTDYAQNKLLMVERTSTPCSASISFWQQIREDWLRNGRDWTKPGFRALAVHRFGTWRMTLRWRLIRAPLSCLYRLGFRYVRNHYGIELPYGTSIGRRLLIAHQSGIVIHRNTVIGDDCLIRQNVTIGSASNDRTHEAPTLGNRVEVGAGACLLGNITIGDDVRIGPNAVVMTDVPSDSAVFGDPARILPLKANQ